jgi:hypothetical protein
VHADSLSRTVILKDLEDRNRNPPAGVFECHCVKRFGDDEQSSAGANRRINGSIELSFMDHPPSTSF